MISNSFFPYLELQWVNSYDTSSALRSCRWAVVAIKSRILYSRLLPVVPHFSPAFSLPLFTRCHSRIPRIRTPAFYPNQIVVVTKISKQRSNLFSHFIHVFARQFRTFKFALYTWLDFALLHFAFYTTPSDPNMAVWKCFCILFRRPEQYFVTPGAFSFSIHFSHM